MRRVLLTVAGVILSVIVAQTPAAAFSTTIACSSVANDSISVCARLSLIGIPGTCMKVDLRQSHVFVGKGDHLLEDDRPALYDVYLRVVDEDGAVFNRNDKNVYKQDNGEVRRSWKSIVVRKSEWLRVNVHADVAIDKRQDTAIRPLVRTWGPYTDCAA